MDSDSMSQILTKVFVLVILIVLSGFFSATETAFFSMNKIRIKSLANDGKKKAKKALKLSEDLDSLLSTILIGNNIVNIATTAIATLLFAELLHSQELGATVATIVITVVVLIFGEITPKSLAKNAPESFAMFASSSLAMLVVVLRPFNWLISMWQKFVYKFIKTGEDHGVTEEELITMVEEAHHDGEIDRNESELIRNAIEFDDIEVEDIYTSRVDIVGVELNDSMEEIAKQFDSGYSRLPVYTDSVDNIIGILNQKDFAAMKKTGQKLTDVMTDPIFVVPSMKISELLRTLQSKKSHMAIILDEFGGTVGIVTLEDILEELVGEIWDEHDTVVEPFVQIRDDKYKVRAKADLDDMFELFDMEGEDEEIDSATVGGWVMEEFGKIPRVGDEFDYGPLHVVVSKRDPRRVTEVIVTKMFDPLDDDDED